jgi:hypothetical protein
MPTIVRAADLDRDRDELIGFLRENLSGNPDERRFDWLYLRNPNGPARVWMAEDDGGRLIGVAGAFPRGLSVKGGTAPGYVLGDFCIAADCRSLGPALALQRACLAALAEEKALWFDLPSSRMVAIYRRLGIQISGELMRYAKLIRLDAKIRDRVPHSGLASGISTVGNLALRVRSWRLPVPADLTIAIHDAEFGEEFTALNAAGAAVHAVYGTRSAAFLNWRYRQHPQRRYFVVTARRKSELVAYATVAVEEAEWRISDILGTGPESIEGLLKNLEDMARERGAEKVTALVTNDGAVAASLKRCGFSAREGQQLIVSAASTGSPEFQDPRAWFLTDGDRES